MYTIDANNVTDAWIKSLDQVLKHGETVSPRGMETKELHPFCVKVRDPQNRIISIEERKLNPGFLAAECLWILRGSDDPWIFDYNSQLIHYANDGRLRGAYGPRLRRWLGVDQFREVINKFEGDLHTRQGTMQIFNPRLDYVEGSKDVPCTQQFRFLARNGKLDMTTIMRSNDAWLGFCYDAFTFTLIQELMANWLNLEVGTYYHIVDSFHIYDKHYDKAESIVEKYKSYDFTEKAEISPTVGFEQLDSMIDSILKFDFVEDLFFNDFGTILLFYHHWKNNKDKRLDFSYNSHHIVSHNLRKVWCNWVGETC